MEERERERARGRFHPDPRSINNSSHPKHGVVHVTQGFVWSSGFYEINPLAYIANINMSRLCGMPHGGPLKLQRSHTQLLLCFMSLLVFFFSCFFPQRTLPKPCVYLCVYVTWVRYTNVMSLHHAMP